MSFVDVVDGGALTDLGEGARAADAEDDLLLDAHLDVAAVEVLGDVAVGPVVLGEVRVEQVQRHATDIALPDADGHLATGQFDLHAILLVGFGVDQATDRLIRKVEIGVGFLLVAVGVEVLVEVSAPVEQAHAAERDPEFGG